jgi:hypothetical protein
MKQRDQWPLSDPTQANLILAFLGKNNHFDVALRYYRLLAEGDGQSGAMAQYLNRHALAAVLAAMGAQADREGRV